MGIDLHMSLALGVKGFPAWGTFSELDETGERQGKGQVGRNGFIAHNSSVPQLH